ncbi:MAG: outer membrane beta-barrel protein [Myxococcales bacterium]|nr:outer membrane beta-barrel protein [Myxococcales bacterium]
MPSSRCLRSLLAAAALMSCLGWGEAAHAFERQWHLGAGVGVAGFPSIENSYVPLNGESLRPPAVGVYTAYGISDYFDWRLELTWGLHSLDGAPEQPIADFETTHVVSASSGLSYKLDVIDWIPYLGVMLGYYGYFGGPHLTSDGLAEGAGSDLGASLVLGLDHALNRDFAVGVQLRYDRLLSGEDYFIGQLRFEHTWGF